MAHLAMHFQDTCGQAPANLYSGMEEGARVIVSAAGGLGCWPCQRRAFTLPPSK
jgi:hydroxymethylglutaryl-CoA lyase